MPLTLMWTAVGGANLRWGHRVRVNFSTVLTPKLHGEGGPQNLAERKPTSSPSFEAAGMIQREEVDGDKVTGGVQPAHAGRGRPPDRPVPAVARIIAASCTGVGTNGAGWGCLNKRFRRSAEKLAKQ